MSGSGKSASGRILKRKTRVRFADQIQRTQHTNVERIDSFSLLSAAQANDDITHHDTALDSVEHEKMITGTQVTSESKAESSSESSASDPEYMEKLRRLCAEIAQEEIEALPDLFNSNARDPTPVPPVTLLQHTQSASRSFYRPGKDGRVDVVGGIARECIEIALRHLPTIRHPRREKIEPYRFEMTEADKRYLWETVHGILRRKNIASAGSVKQSETRLWAVKTKTRPVVYFNGSSWSPSKCAFVVEHGYETAAAMDKR